MRARRECRWFRRRRALLALDPVISGVLALAESPHVQHLMAEHGSVAAMLARMSRADRELLGAQVAAIRAE